MASGTLRLGFSITPADTAALSTPRKAHNAIDALVVRDFYPIAYLPRGVRLTAYSGEAGDLPSDVLQPFLDDVARGRLKVPIHRAYSFDEIVTAHADMEANNAVGKLVVVL